MLTTRFPGLYPTIGGKIANNGPYANFRDVYKLKILSEAEKDQIKGYEAEFTATASTGLDVMRGRDPYRRSFNK
jgi:photosystem II PsbU protein